MTAADKQLIVVVEGTPRLGFYWSSIVSDYLDKIVRSFCGSVIPGQKPSASGSTFELGLVMFHAHGPYSDSGVQRSSWTKDVDSFLGWLSSITFSGGGLEDVAIAEGLSEALMMFAIPQNGYQTQQRAQGKKHCILIAVSNPYPFRTPVYRPQIDNTEQIKNCLYDAETVAQWFGQCDVSLSVISPKQLPKLRAIYNAGRNTARGTDLPVDAKHPHFLVLVADSFIEARGALNQTGVSSPVQPEISPQVQQGMVQQVRSGMQQQVPQRVQQPKYVKIWEGNLCAQTTTITRLEAYRNATSSKTLAANWPSTMQILRMVTQDHMNNQQYFEEADIIVLNAMDEHNFLQKLQQRKLYAIVKLPTQTLLLSVSEKARLLVGRLYPADRVVIEPQNPSQ